MAEKLLMNSINKTYERAKEENLGVSKNFIRVAVLEGLLPCIQLGTKKMIRWDAFMDFLQNGNATTTKASQPTAQGVRAIPSNLRSIPHFRLQEESNP